MGKYAIVMCALGLSAGCSSTVEGPDAGSDGGSFTTETCRAARFVEGVEGEPVVLTGDSAMITHAPLGDTCWAEAAPTEVIAYTVPGSGDVGVVAYIDSLDMGEHYPAVELRRDCDAGHPVADFTTYCSSNAPYPERETMNRSVVGIVARGGETLYLVVTEGWTDGCVDCPRPTGRWELTVETTGIGVPTIEEATMELSGGTTSAGSLMLGVAGTDDDDDVIDRLVTLYDADGVEIDDSGNNWHFRTLFDGLDVDDAPGRFRFTDDYISIWPGLPAEPATAEIVVFDRTRQASDPITVDVTIR